MPGYSWHIQWVRYAREVTWWNLRNTFVVRIYLREILPMLVNTKRICRWRMRRAQKVMTSYAIRIRDSAFVALRKVPINWHNTDLRLIVVEWFIGGSAQDQRIPDSSPKVHRWCEDRLWFTHLNDPWGHSKFSPVPGPVVSFEMSGESPGPGLPIMAGVKVDLVPLEQ
jgi:hypothetical protein